MARDMILPSDNPECPRPLPPTMCAIISIVYASLSGLFFSELVYYHGPSPLLPLAKVSAIGLAAFAIADIIRSTAQPRKRTSAFWIVTACIAWTASLYILHGLTRPPPSDLYSSIRTASGASLALLIGWSWMCSPQRPGEFALGLIATALVGTLYSVVQSFLPHGLVHTAPPARVIISLTSDCWILLPRAQGLFTDPNYASVLFCAAFGLSLTIGRKWFGVRYACVLSAILFCSILATRSRMGILIGLGILLVSLGWRRSTLAIFGGAVAALLSISLCWPGMFRLLNEAGTHQVSTLDENSSASIRSRAIQAGFTSLISNPLVGVGPGASAVPIRGSPHPIHSHNSLLDVGVETGLPGMVPFALLLALACYAITRTMIGQADVMQQAMACLVFAAISSSMFLVQHTSKNFWLLLLPPLVFLLAPQSTKPDPPHA